MSKDVGNTILGSVIGGIISGAVCFSGYLIFNKLNKKQENKNRLNQLNIEIEIQTTVVDRLKKEASHLSMIITENTMTVDQMKNFDNGKAVSDRLIVVNESWKNAEIKLKTLMVEKTVLVEYLSKH